MSSSKSARRNRRKRRMKNIEASAPMPRTSKGDDPLTLCAVVSFDRDALSAKPDDGTKRQAKFAMNAYNGKMMTPMGYPYPVVVNLSGVKHDGEVPIFLDHEVSGSGLVGHAKVSVSNSINLDGIVSAKTSAAETVVESAKQGFPWKCSIGCQVEKRTFIEDGESAVVNGMKFKGPFYVIDKSYLYETSFVPIGADRTTSASIAAKRKEPSMADERTDDAAVSTQGTETLNSNEGNIDTKAPRTFDKNFSKFIKASGFDPEVVSEEWTDQQIRTLKSAFEAERDAKETVEAGESYTELVARMRSETKGELDRQEKIRDICRHDASLMAQAIGEGWTVEKTELAKLRKELDVAPRSNFSSRGYAPPDSRVMEAAMCMTAGIRPSWLDVNSNHWKDWKGSQNKGYSEQELDAASDLGEYTFGRLFHEYLATSGVSVAPGTTMSELIGKVKDTHRTLRASSGFSTVSISGILSNVMNKRLLEMFETVNPVAQRISASRSVSDFKETKQFRLTGNGDFLMIEPTGEIQQMGLRETEHATRPYTYGRMINVSREMLINDDLGALTGVTRVLGRKGATKLQKVFFTMWLGTGGSTLFTAGHNNTLTTALGEAGLTAGEKLFMDQTDADGDPVDVMPAILLVPNDLKVTAEKLMASTTTITVAPGASGGDQATYVTHPNANPHVGKWNIEVSPWLNNSSLTGYSTTAWWLLADPGVLPAAEIVYLNGRQTPHIESEDADFSVLGFQWRAYFDFGCQVLDYQGAVKSTGAG